MKKLLFLTIILAGLSCSLFAWSLGFAQTDSTQIAKDTCVDLSKYLFLLDYYFTTNFANKPATVVVETVYVPILKHEAEQSSSSKFWQAWQKQEEVSQREKMESDLRRIKEQNDELLWRNRLKEREDRDKKAKDDYEEWKKKMEELEGR